MERGWVLGKYMVSLGMLETPCLWIRTPGIDSRLAGEKGTPGSHIQEPGVLVPGVHREGLKQDLENLQLLSWGLRKPELDSNGPVQGTRGCPVYLPPVFPLQWNK